MTSNIIRFHEISDNRGVLVSLEQNRNIPFEVKRVYYLYGMAESVQRGFHAHKSLEQVAVCVKGACSFLLDDGQIQKEYRLDSPGKGLYIGKYVWREMFDFTKDCVIIVLASDLYDESDYIREYGDFIAASSLCAVT